VIELIFWHFLKLQNKIKHSKSLATGSGGVGFAPPGSTSLIRRRIDGLALNRTTAYRRAELPVNDGDKAQSGNFNRRITQISISKDGFRCEAGQEFRAFQRGSIGLF